MRKIYYYLKLKNTSPIHIGNEENINTDLDIIKNKDGSFFIPGTSLAGSILHCLNEQEQELFNPMKNGKYIQSPIIINDARMINNDDVEIRNGISLDKNKITNHTAKYDYEVIPSNNEFKLCIEITERNGEVYSNLMNKIFSLINNQDIKVGYKTTRGLGRLHIEKIGRKVFDKNNFKEYFQFDRYNIKNYDNFTIEENNSEKYIKIKVDLSLRYGISIRTYNNLKDDIDFEHMKSKGKNVIPATSWNGLLRKSMENYINKLNLDIDIVDIFGNASNDYSKKIKSKIYIDDSIFDKEKNEKDKKGKEFVFVRNKIDPFYGSASKGALYKERCYYGGDTELNISLSKDIKNIKLVICLLMITFRDLDYGIIALGGETAIGRGLFEVKQIYVNDEKKNYSDYMEVNS